MAITFAKRIQDRIDMRWRPLELSYKIKQLNDDIHYIVNRKEGQYGEN